MSNPPTQFEYSSLLAWTGKKVDEGDKEVAIEAVDSEPEPDPEPAKSKHNLERIDKMAGVSEVRFEPEYITTNGAYVQTSHKYD